MTRNSKVASHRVWHASYGEPRDELRQAVLTMSHTPRKRRKDERASLSSGNGALMLDPESKEAKPAFPLAALLLPAKGAVSSWLTLPLILMAVGLFRWSTGFWGYSGQ